MKECVRRCLPGVREADLKVRGHENTIAEIQGTINKALIGLKGGGRWKETKQENSFGTNIIRKRSLGKQAEHILSPGDKQSMTVRYAPVPPVTMARSHQVGVSPPAAGECGGSVG